MSSIGIENAFSVEELRRARDVIAPELTRMLEERADLVVVSADMGPSVAQVRERHPDRYIDFGIAETNAMSAAGGLAASGMIPYVIAMAPFCAVKCAEQIRTDLSYTQLPVRIIARLSGVAVGWFGPSHHSLEDIAITRSIANLTVVAPSDGNSTLAVLRSTIDWEGPVFVRVSAGVDKVVHQEIPDITRGKFLKVREGKDITIVATGAMVAASVAAAEELAAEGIEAAVLDAVYLKPLDEDALGDAMSATGTILTVEEHSVVGGLGTAAAEALMRHGAMGRFGIHGFPDEEILVSTPAALMQHYGLSSAGIAARARRLLGVEGVGPK